MGAEARGDVDQLSWAAAPRAEARAAEGAEAREPGRRLSVLLLSAFFEPDPIAKRMSGLARGLAARGHEVRVVTRWPTTLDGAPLAPPVVKEADRRTPAGVRVLRVGERGEPKRGRGSARVVAQVAFAWRALLRAVRAPGRCDVVVAYTPPPFVGAAALVASRVRRLPLVLEVQDLYPDQAVALGFVREGALVAVARAVERAMYRGAARLVVVTRGYREHVLERGACARRVVVIPNSCDVGLFRPDVEPLDEGEIGAAPARLERALGRPAPSAPGSRAEVADGGGGAGLPASPGVEAASAGAAMLVPEQVARQRAAVRHAGGIAEPRPQRPFRVVFAGTVGLAQGLEVVLDAAERLRGRRDIRIEVFGGGARFGALAGEARARDLENVRFAPGVAHREMPRLLARGDALLLTLHPHPIFRRVVPSKLSECLAMGRPVVAAAAGEVAALLQETGAGVAVAPGDGAALARALEDLAGAPERRRSMGERARAVAVRCFADHLAVEQYVRVIEDVCGVVAARDP